MINEVFLKKPFDRISGLVDLKNLLFFIDGKSDPCKFDNKKVINRRILHYCNYLQNHDQKSISFQQIFWPENAMPGSLYSRKIQLRKKNYNEISFSIDPYDEYSSLELSSIIDSGILDNIEDVVLITEADSVEYPSPRVIFANKSFERMTGYNINEIIGSTPRKLQGINTSQEEKQKIRHALQNWQTITTELLNYKKDGTPFYAELKISPIKDHTGWWTYWIAVQRDITNRKIKDAIQTAANRTITVETMSSGIAHDLNNQIAIAANQLSVIEQDLNKNSVEKNQEVIEKIKILKDRLIASRAITSQFMNMNNHKKYKIETVDIMSFIKQTCSVASLGNKTQLSFDLRSNVSIPPMEIDKGLFSQVLTSLIINSSQAMNENVNPNSINAIKVQVEYTLNNNQNSPNYIKVRVQDSGPGIPDSILEKLFSPYVTTKKNGTGLGLFISQNNMMKMGGYLLLLSTGPSGSTFEIGIPTHVNKNSKAEKRNKKNYTLDKSLPILLIDDELDLLNSFSDILSYRGFKVKVASNLDEALVLIENNKFSLAICDLNLGAAFITDKIIEKIKSLSASQAIGIMSGGDILQDSRISETLKKYSDIILFDKPFEIEEIINLFNDNLE